MTRSHKLFLNWLLQSSLIFFLIYFLSDQGIILKIVSSDKSYITTLIMLVYIIVTIHCVYHTFLISKELNKAHIIKKSLIKENVKLRIIENNLILTSKGEISDGIVSDYFKDLIGLKKNGATSHVQILDSYKKKTVTFYEFGWFCSDVMLKLGLIGTVIGFIIMLSSLIRHHNIRCNFITRCTYNYGKWNGSSLIYNTFCSCGRCFNCSPIL